MRYRISHRTHYTYESPVTVCHYLARLAPRALPTQGCPWHELEIFPEPTARAVRNDCFGNATVYFEMAGAHNSLQVNAHSLVEVNALPPPNPDISPAWETIRDACKADTLTAAAEASEFIYASTLIVPAPEFAVYAQTSFPTGKPILAGVCNLNHRINTDFKFDPTATDAATPVTEAFKKRRGVCQDFAQVMIACLRSIGLPARYVSGYLETQPPPGQVKLVGADASHAWISVWCGDEFGWMDADPTNDILPAERHITVAWGRDFSDVSPLRGVTLGAGKQTLTVGVDVMPQK